MWKALDMAFHIDMLHTTPLPMAASLSMAGVLAVLVLAGVGAFVVFNILQGKKRKERRERWRNSPGWGATGLPVGGVSEQAPQILSAEQLDGFPHRRR